MSVYTTVKSAQLEFFLQRYNLGRASRLSPIAAGITNTNYFLETDSGDFILTLYEHHSDDELDYMLGLQRHLAKKGILCPAPVSDRRDDYFSTLNQRPAAIIHHLPGKVISSPDPDHCALVASELARFHLAGHGFDGKRLNPRGIHWLLAVSDMLADDLNSDDRRLVEKTINEYRRFDCRSLPSGAIHADLFHDNALFVDAGLGGIIDFDYACYDYFVFDIAVLINDWCIDERCCVDQNRLAALLQAYQHQRQLKALEIEVLPMMLRITALRFWLSRFYDKLNPLSGELTYSKDPNGFRTLLSAHHQQAETLKNLISPHHVG